MTARLPAVLRRFESMMSTTRTTSRLTTIDVIRARLSSRRCVLISPHLLCWRFGLTLLLEPLSQPACHGSARCVLSRSVGANSDGLLLFGTERVIRVFSRTAYDGNMMNCILGV